jgi:hypothetical protein
MVAEGVPTLTVGASLAPARLTMRALVVVAEPSLTWTLKTSVVEAVSALMAAALGA